MEPTRTRNAPMRSLFTRYVQGQIDEPVWGKIMQALDDQRIHASERLALAAYVNDAVQDRALPAITMLDTLGDLVTQPSVAFADIRN